MGPDPLATNAGAPRPRSMGCNGTHLAGLVARDQVVTSDGCANSGPQAPHLTFRSRGRARVETPSYHSRGRAAELAVGSAPLSSARRRGFLFSVPSWPPRSIPSLDAALELRAQTCPSLLLAVRVKPHQRDYQRLSSMAACH